MADRLTAGIHPSGDTPRIPAIVRVDRNVRGAWEVVSDEGERLTYKTLEEAHRMADRLAAGIRPCETIILDAYHRVVHLELNRETHEG